MSFKKTTEQDSYYDHLEKMSLVDLIHNINEEDQTVAFAVKKSISQIKLLTEKIIEKLQNGGRLFYLGAGTSGRLGILDASECPPTFGVSHKLVVGLIAGGDKAIRKAVEFAEDSQEQGWKDLENHQKDTENKYFQLIKIKIIFNPPEWYNELDDDTKYNVKYNLQNFYTPNILKTIQDFININKTNDEENVETFNSTSKRLKVE